MSRAYFFVGLCFVVFVVILALFLNKDKLFNPPKNKLNDLKNCEFSDSFENMCLESKQKILEKKLPDLNHKDTILYLYNASNLLEESEFAREWAIQKLKKANESGKHVFFVRKNGINQHVSLSLKDWSTLFVFVKKNTHEFEPNQECKMEKNCMLEKVKWFREVTFESDFLYFFVKDLQKELHIDVQSIVKLLEKKNSIVYFSNEDAFFDIDNVKMEYIIRQTDVDFVLDHMDFHPENNESKLTNIHFLKEKQVCDYFYNLMINGTFIYSNDAYFSEEKCTATSKTTITRID